MVRNELVAMIEQLGEYQVEQIRKIAEGFLSLNEELNDTIPQKLPLLQEHNCTFYQGFFWQKATLSVRDLQEEVYL